MMDLLKLMFWELFSRFELISNILLDEPFPQTSSKHVVQPIKAQYILSAVHPLDQVRCTFVDCLHMCFPDMTDKVHNDNPTIQQIEAPS